MATKNMNFALEELAKFRSRGVDSLLDFHAKIAISPFLHFDPVALALFETRKSRPLRIVMLGYDEVLGPGFCALLKPQGLYAIVGKNNEGLDSISLKDLRQDAKSGDVLAINCVTFDHEKKLMYDHFCSTHSVPVLSFHQAARLLNLNYQLGTQDYYFSSCFESTLSHFSEHLRVFEKFEDDHSKELFACILLNRLSGLEEFLALRASPLKSIYFECLNFKRTSVVFADAGALNGRDTINFFKLLGDRAKAAHVFEPSQANAAITRHNLSSEIPERLWSLHMEAVSDAVGHMYFQDGASDFCYLATTEGAGGSFVKVPTTTIDVAASDANLIKLEIEGAEFGALMGARETIRRNRSDLVVSIYHRADDFLKIPELLSELTDAKYRWTLRHNTLCFSHTILYLVDTMLDDSGSLAYSI